ncbi:MAG: oligosaccharide flippase family protein [Methanosarcinales archaeon]|nr:oligosaccharide flippase family protein [Methanosarcinales archaeon]
MKITIPKNSKELKQHLDDPLFKNSYFLMVSTIIGSILGFIFWMLVTRYYMPHDVGLATALISIVNLLTTFSLLGFNFGILRFLPNEKDKMDMINSCLTVTFFFAVVLSLIFILGIGTWSPTLLFMRESLIFTTVFTVFVFTNSLVRLQQTIFVALRSAKLSLIQNTILSTLKLIFVIFLVAFGVFGIISSWTIAACIVLILSSILLLPMRVHSYLPIPTIKKKIIKDMFQISFGNYIAENFAVIPNSILPLMIISVLTPEMNAYFFMALAILNILLVVPVAINGSLFVEGSYAPDKFRNNVIKALKFTFLLIIPMIFGIFIFGDKLLLLFGKTYSENAYYVLCVLVLSIIPFAINKLYMTIKNIQLKVKSIIYLNVFISILTVAISYLLMLKIGLIGVAIGYTLAQGIGAVVVLAAVKMDGWI